MEDYERLLAEQFQGTEPGIAEENLQAPHPRQPGDGALQQVRLACPHHRQQERDVGRLRDLYGDMAGGFAVLKDV